MQRRAAAPKPPITSKFASVSEFLQECGCAQYLTAFGQAEMPVKMLPKLSADVMVSRMKLPLGPAMSIEDAASKFAPL